MTDLVKLSAIQVMVYLSATVLMFILLKHRYFSPISDIPGPFLGTFGTCFQVWEIFRGRIGYTLLRLHRRYGPLVRISHHEVSVNHPDALRILSTPLRKADFYKPMAVPNSNYNNLMSEQDPKQYAAMRSNIAAAFSLSNVIRNEADMDKTIALLKTRLDELSARNEPVELGQWLHFLTHDLLGEIVFSSRFGFLDQGRDIGKVVQNNFFLSIYVTSIVYMQWLHIILLGNPVLRWLDFQPNEHTYNTAVKSVAARKAHTTPKVDMMQHWLEQRHKHPERFSEREMFANVVSTLGAGGGTVGAVLGSFFYFLLKEDSVHLQRLRREIDGAQLSEIVSFAEAQQLPYLQAVVRALLFSVPKTAPAYARQLKETLRLWPPVPWNLPREVPKEGFTVAGHHFREGTILSVNPWLIHRNHECFGADADDYDPERWLRNEDLAKQMEKFLIPFGLGYNVCPGRNVANLELSKITATLIKDFDFRLAEPEREWRFHQLFATTQGGWPVYVKQRC